MPKYRVSSAFVPHVSEPPPPVRFLSRLWRAFVILLVAAACASVLIAEGRALAVWGANARAALEYRYNLNYGEGPLLDQAARIARGEPLYDADLSEPPYTITNYPPLYMMLQAPFVSWFGASFTYGRILSLVSGALAALFLVLIIRAITHDWPAALAGGLALLSTPYIAYWSSLARIDTLALMLSLAGIWLAVRWPQRDPALLAAGLLMVLAALTRQTYLLAAPMATFAWLWGSRYRYSALVFAVAFGAIALAALAVLLVSTKGGFFFHIVTANVNALDPEIVGSYFREILRALPFFLAGIAAFVLLGFIQRPTDPYWDARPRHGATLWWLAAPYALGAVAVALTIAKVGSDMNYLYELMTAACLCAAGLINWARRLLLIRAALFALLALQVWWASDLMTGKYALLTEERTRAQAEMDQLYATVRDADGAVLADEYMGLLTLAGKPILFQPFEMSQLAQAGLWDERPFVAALERGDYPRVLLYQPYRNPGLRFERWTREMLRAINEHYRPTPLTAETIVYVYAGS